MSATAAVWKEELNSKHIWPFSLSLSEITEMDTTACVIQYASNITRPPHLFPIATHTRDSISPHEFDPSQFLIYSFFGGVLFECCYHLCGEIQFNLDVVTIVYKHVNRGLGETQYCTHARRHVDWSISTIKPLGHSCCWLTIPFRMWGNAAKWKNRNLVLLQKFRFLAGLTFNSIAAHQKIWKDFFFYSFPPKAYYSARPTEFKFEFSIRVVGF